MITLVLEPRDSNHNNDYLNYLLRSVPFQEEFYRNGRGIVADLWTTRFQAMKDISLALPPLEEQAKIAEYLSNEKLLNETRLEAAEEAISLLKEKRQALISEAVTGQLDIDAYESLTS